MKLKSSAKNTTNTVLPPAPPRLSEISLGQHFTSAAIGGMVFVPCYMFLSRVLTDMLSLPPTLSSVIAGALGLFAGVQIYREHAVGATVITNYNDALHAAKGNQKKQSNNTASPKP